MALPPPGQKRQVSWRPWTATVTTDLYGILREAHNGQPLVGPGVARQLLLSVLGVSLGRLNQLFAEQLQ